MGWQDRRYQPDFGEGGGLRRALRRIFVEGDDFFNWALPFFRLPVGFPFIGGIQVRIHLLYLVWMAAELIFPADRSAIGFTFAAFFVGTLFVLVLLHEFGHCVACRLVGGEAERILMWPLGGLAFCRAPHAWKPNLITTLGGPAVNLILIPIFAGVLLTLGAGWGAVVYNPFNPHAVWNEPWFTHNTTYWRYFLWSAYNANLALFLFNMLLPMFPMDAGRIVQELLWRQLGYKRSMLIATNLGLALAIVVGAVGVFTKENMLTAVAVFAGITCYQEKRKLALLDDWADTVGVGDGNSGGGEAWKAGVTADVARDRAEFNKAAKAQQRARDQQAEVDRILAKIAQSGMASLTRSEKATLKEATERQRSH